LDLSDRILELLYDRPAGFFGLDDLAAAAGTDSGVVEGALERLAARGHRFERTPVQGVRLLRPTLLDAHLVERDLPVEQIGRHVICFGEVDSTNDVAFDSARQAGGRALVVTAEFQRAGRGRGGRKWLSPPGGGVLASVLLHEAAARLPGEALTIAAGLAVAEGVEAGTGVHAGLEWPNDVVIDGAKVAGVIVEVRSAEVAAGRAGRVVVGLGINVNAAPPAEQVARAVTCLSESAGRTLERIEILRAVLLRLDEWVAGLLAAKAEDLHRRWCARCQMINRRVTVTSGRESFTGRVLDVSPFDGLILLTDDGRRVHLPAATSTVTRQPEGAL